MGGSDGPRGLIDSFSLVAYLPEPLASFIEKLRQEVEPTSEVRGHVTVLPPRWLPEGATLETAWNDLQALLQNRSPFRLSLGAVRVFDQSGVVHLTIGKGLPELARLHTALCHKCFEGAERFEYRPHVTLAHLTDPKAVAAAKQLAKERWAEYTEDRSFAVERLTLVKFTTAKRWQNLYQYTMRQPVVV